MSRSERQGRDIAVAVMIFLAGWLGAGAWAQHVAVKPSSVPETPKGITVSQYEGVCKDLRAYAEDPGSLGGCDAAVANIVDQAAKEAANEVQYQGN